jgi:hypothetical protein
VLGVSGEFGLPSWFGLVGVGVVVGAVWWGSVEDDDSS